MLGEKIGELQAKTTGRRVIPGDEHGPRMESSFEAQGLFFGVEVVDFGTYDAKICDGGVLEGKGQGISMTKDGETVTWTATGIGKMTGKGMAVQWRGSIHYHTTSQKLARANNTCFVFEYDIDESGAQAAARIYEWK